MTSKLNFLHMCDYASIDQSGKLSILGIFENIYSISDAPFTHPNFFVVANIYVHENGNHRVSVRVINETSSELIKSPDFNVVVSDGMKNVGILAQLNQVKFTGFGPHFSQVFLDNKKIGEVKFEVVRKS